MQTVDELSRPPSPREETKPNESGAEKPQGRGLGNIRRGAAIRGKPGGKSPRGDCAGRRTGKGVDRCIRTIGIVDEHGSIGSPQPRRISDLKADRIRGVAIS